MCACRRNAAAEEGKPKSAYKHLRSSDADLRPRYAGEDKYVRLGASPADLRSLARRYRDHAAENFLEGPADATVLWRHFKEKAYGQIQSRMRPAAGNQRAQTRNVPGCASPGSPPLVGAARPRGGRAHARLCGGLSSDSHRTSVAGTTCASC